MYISIPANCRLPPQETPVLGHIRTSYDKTLVTMLDMQDEDLVLIFATMCIQKNFR